MPYRVDSVQAPQVCIVITAPHDAIHSAGTEQAQHAPLGHRLHAYTQNAHTWRRARYKTMLGLGRQGREEKKREVFSEGSLIL